MTWLETLNFDGVMTQLLAYTVDEIVMIGRGFEDMRGCMEDEWVA